MLTTYPEIRDRIYKLAREHKLRVDWSETSRAWRTLRLFDARQVEAAKAKVPVRNIQRQDLEQLSWDLQRVFEKGWME